MLFKHIHEDKQFSYILHYLQMINREEKPGKTEENKLEK